MLKALKDEDGVEDEDDCEDGDDVPEISLEDLDQTPTYKFNRKPKTESDVEELE